jgi:hypothetical protein
LVGVGRFMPSLVVCDLNGNVYDLTVVIITESSTTNLPAKNVTDVRPLVFLFHQIVRIKAFATRIGELLRHITK